MHVVKNEWSSYFREKVLIEMNFFCHINNMGVEVIWHRGSPHIYVVDAVANVLDTHIIYMTKKIQIFDNFFQQIARPIIFISPHTAYRAFCGLIKIKFVTNL